MEQSGHNYNMNIIKVKDIRKYWREAFPFFEKVIDDNTTYVSIGHVHDMINNGTYKLLVIMDDYGVMIAAMVYEIVTCPTGARVLMIPQLGGEKIEEWISPLINYVYDIADLESCERVLISGGRPGWKKIMAPYGGKLAYVTIEYDVDEWIKNKSNSA